MNNSKNTFDPTAWQTSEEKPAKTTPTVNAQPTSNTENNSSDVELITCRIESAEIDITSGYDNWRDIGFSLSSELGENGRSIYQRISRFHPEYSKSETDKQFDKCLRSKGSGITIKTFFAKAKEAGIDIRTGRTGSQISPIYPKSPDGEVGENGDLEKEEAENLPTFSNEIMDSLPPFLRKIAVVGESPQESDSIILGAVTVISGCLPTVYGIYDSIRVYANLFYFLTARAASGKGRLNQCKKIANGIHQRLKEYHDNAKKQYKARMDEWEEQKKGDRGPKPEKPKQLKLFIPANNSSTGVYQLMAENDEKGIFFETEGDTLTRSFKNDFGDFSDGLRKAFHHEHISYHRRGNDEDIEIDNPRLSVVLSGTPRQVAALIGDAENGLFSRFMFYRLNSSMEWKDVFAARKEGAVDVLFTNYGKEFLEFYDILTQSGEKQFSFTQEQSMRFFTCARRARGTTCSAQLGTARSGQIDTGYSAQ